MLIDNLLLLPIDILVHIFRKLRPSDLRNVMLTCKTLCDFIKNDNRIWRSFSKDSIILEDSVDNRWFSDLPWYERCRISHNWQIGCYKCKTLVRHYTNYMPWLKFHKSEVLLLSMGSELFCYRTNSNGMPNCSKPLWRIEVPKIRRHDVRTNDISRFVINNNTLVCGNRDGCVAVYKLNNIHKRPTLKWHIKDCLENGQVEVSTVEIIDDDNQLLVVTGSTKSPVLLMCTLRNNNEMMVVPNDTNNLRYIALRDCGGTKCLSFNKTSTKLAIGLNGNSRPLLLDMNNNQFLMMAETTINHRQAVRDIQWHNENTVVFVTHSGQLQLLDTRTQEVVYKAKDPFQSSLYCVKTDNSNGIIVGSAEYSRCVLFDARQASYHVQMYFTQRNTSPVYCLDFDSTKLITAVDRSVAVLNFNIDSTSQEGRDYSRHIFH